MRSIGMAVADTFECAAALDAAFTLGSTLGADVTGLHVRPLQAPEQTVSLADAWAGAGMYAGWYQMDESETRAAAEEARKLFADKAAEHGYALAASHGGEAPAAIFQEREGDPDKLFAGFGALHDLLVASRPEPRGGQRAFAVMMSALMDGAAPVLLLPQRPVKISTSRMAVGWKGGRPEALLLRTTLPLLRSAEEVVLITAGGEQRGGAGAEEMSGYLKAHGINARAIKAGGGRAGEALEKSARDEGADLLLCGAYSRGRMREMIFGGVTEYLVGDSEMPVIMLHL